MRYADRLNPDTLKRYASALNARARTIGARGSLSPDDLRGVILDSGGACGWCGQSLVNRELELDHIISLSTGGAHTPTNLTVSCPDCNRRKSDRHAGTFAQEQVARGGALTPLIRRVLAHYGIDNPATQGALFPTDDALPPPLVLTDGEDDPDDIPPYRW